MSIYHICLHYINISIRLLAQRLSLYIYIFMFPYSGYPLYVHIYAQVKFQCQAPFINELSDHSCYIVRMCRNHHSIPTEDLLAPLSNFKCYSHYHRSLMIWLHAHLPDLLYWHRANRVFQMVHPPHPNLVFNNTTTRKRTPPPSSFSLAEKILSTVAPKIPSLHYVHLLYIKIL